MDDPNAEEIRTTLGKINRAKISLAFLQQATNALQRSGLLSWPEGELNVTDRILATMRSAEADLADMIVYAEQHSKTNVRS